MVYAAKRNPDRCPTHPGALLRDDVIPATGRTKAEIAQLLGISRQHLYDILEERKPVSPAVAVRLGKLFGDGAAVWVRMQSAYDTWRAGVGIVTVDQLEAGLSLDIIRRIRNHGRRVH